MSNVRTFVRHFFLRQKIKEEKEERERTKTYTASERERENDTMRYGEVEN